jgi:subtilase family serine protease
MSAKRSVRHHHRRAAIAAAALTGLLMLAALAPPVASAAAPARPTAQGIAATRNASNPHWACAHGLCDAIVDPSPAAAASAGVRPAVYAKHKPEGGGPEGGIDPEELRAAYAIPTNGGAGQTIAVIEAFTYKQAEKDLAKYRSHYGMAPCTSTNGCLAIVNAEGGAPEYHGFTEWEPEVALDLDMVSAACPECHLLLLSAETETFRALGAAVNRAAAMGATEISNSYGLAEELCEPECGEVAAAWNHPGIFTTVSSGDYGYDNELIFAASPSFPAVLPTVAAVGGTALRHTTAKRGRGYSEKVWGERSLGVGTGSGCGTYAKPAWQADSGCAGRTDNDVAAVGACATPVSAFDSTEGGWIDLCGTSASSPLIAGIEAHASVTSRAMQGGKAFYAGAALFDVKSGSDGRCALSYLCHGEVGYDGPTGEGTPDGPLP